MSASDVRNAVQEAKATELSRLGSSKSLYAATGGEMEGDAVLAAAADADAAAADAFEAWAESEENEQAREVFEGAAVDERDHVETILAELGDHVPDTEDDAMADHLHTIEGTVARAGAFLGRVLVADGSKSQYVGYFVGNADPQTASVFRDLRGDLDEQEERALELLDAVCESDADWDAAETAALETVATAYEAHVATLEDLGVDPKPVC